MTRLQIKLIGWALLLTGFVAVPWICAPPGYGPEMAQFVAFTPLLLFNAIRAAFPHWALQSLPEYIFFALMAACWLIGLTGVGVLFRLRPARWLALVMLPLAYVTIAVALAVGRWAVYTWTSLGGSGSDTGLYLGTKLVYGDDLYFYQVGRPWVIQMLIVTAVVLPPIILGMRSLLRPKVAAYFDRRKASPEG